MKLSPRKINLFLFFKLPAAYWTGVRVKAITENSCEVHLKHRWINQNPFRSIFWAVQGMAAELTTGALVMNAIRESGADISMLVASNKGLFMKKATGKITFTCEEGTLIKSAVQNAISTGEGQLCQLTSVGKNENGEIVSRFEFEWTLRMRVKEIKK